MKPMTRAEFISRLADRLGYLPAGEVKAAVLAITERLGLALRNGERVEIRGFGGFSLHRRPPRVGRNPKTGEAVELPARFVVHFKPGKELRERVDAVREIRGTPLDGGEYTATVPSADTADNPNGE